MTSTWKELFQAQMLTRKCVSSINLFSLFWVTLLLTKPYYAIIRIPRGLILGLSLFYRPKTKFSKIIEIQKPILNYLIIFLRERLNGLITKSRSNYYQYIANKLNNVLRNSKAYWSLLRFFLTNKNKPAHEHWDTRLQLCMWDDHHVFSMATLVFTRLLLDEIYHLIELPFDWLIDDAMFVCLLDELILDFCYSNFDMGNRWIWTWIDYHPCITSEPTNQMY